VVWLFVRKVVEPLEQLRDTAEAIGSGDFSRRIEVKSKDECGELAQVFNQMTDNLKRSRDELESTVERLKTTQAHLVQSEKLSGIGEFVAGVAHELNNPLTTVMGFSELLKSADNVSPEHTTFVEMIFKSAQRCQKIVQALLSFARRHQPERKPACVNKLIESSLEILSYQLRTSNIEAQLRLDPKLPLAMVDTHQIQQVIINIINNARHAIEAHRPKGWIRITTEPAGPNVRIAIQDSGPGIAPENLSKIFDPFFTTKEVGKGTGLGLSLCYGIIKEHGGSIIPLSRRGEGATFIIELPITQEGESPDPASAAGKSLTTNSSAGAGKRVLVIDDEEPILRMISEILTRQGYMVDVAADGETGLKRLQQNNYDVTLCDWKMPGLNGRQVYEQAREANPTLSGRFIFITGDLVNDRTRKFLDAENNICLPKPFSLSEFSAAISRVMV
jgi:two-component system NtrC family sensor kinase